MLIQANIYSEVLAMNMDVDISLPPSGRHAEANSLKTLWLLHGGSGDHSYWFRFSSVERYANEYGVAVITPGARQSCFTNMAHGGRFADYVGEELPQIMRSLFPQLSGKREDNFISGLSNGGYGSFRVGLAFPETFGAIGAFSAGNKAYVLFENDGSSKAGDRIAAFGAGSLVNTEHDISYLGQRCLDKGPVPRVYHACGGDDPWLDLNLKTREFFIGQKDDAFNYVYHQADGYGHVWDFWDMEIQNFLDYLGITRGEPRY